MGEVISYTKVALDEFLADAEIVGTDLILTRKSGEVITIDLTGVGVDEAYVNTAIAGLVDAAPGTLDTLNEIAAALGDDANLATTLNNTITAVKAGAMGVVIHGATASVARPAGYGAIHWIGTVAPTNSIDNDLWTDPNA